jgi:Glycosyltransferase family 87
MTRTRRIGLALFLLCSGISFFWGLALARTSTGGSSGFQAIYYGTRCLLQHHNPYKQSELEAVYRDEGGQRPSESFQLHQAVTLYVNLPTTFIVIAPLALMPWWAAHALWLLLLATVFFLAAFLIWSLAASYSPGVSLFLVCLLIANAEVIFGSGNTAGLVVSLCVVAVCCFLEDRFVLAGVLCLGISLAIKPHDVGLVWLYFLLAGGAYRKRALHALVVTAVLGLSAFLWVSVVVPHWMQDWLANLSAISAAGGINQPGLASFSGRTPDMVIDLQAALSIFRDNPHFYNPASYLICGVLILIWAIRTLRSRVSPADSWLALAAIVPLTLLVTYHRPYDAKLLLLTIPACALLWARGGVAGHIALLVSTAGILLSGDIPLAILVILADKLHIDASSLVGQLLTVVLLRPASLVLLVMGIFYLWVYVRGAEPRA